MNKDFLIVSGEWHDGLYYPTIEGTLGGYFRSRLMILIIPLFFTNILFVQSYSLYL